MKKEEKKLLINKKVKEEGKDYDSAEFELELNDACQRNIKYDFRNLKKQVKELTKENQRLTKLLNKRLVPEEIKVKSILPNEDEPKKIKYNDRSCSVKYLYRIIKFIEDNPNVNITQIKEVCLFPNNEFIKEALNFLIKYKVIKSNGVTYERSN